MDRHFHDQLRDENLYFAFGEHWLFLVLKTFLFVVLLGIFSVLPWFLNQYMPAAEHETAVIRGLLVADFCIALFLIHRFFLWLLAFCGSFVIVTNFRIIVIKKSIFLRSEKEVLDLSQIRDIQMRKRGLFCNIFNCGDINLILSTQEKDATVIRRVYDPYNIQAKCNAIRHRRIQRKYRWRDQLAKVAEQVEQQKPTKEFLTHNELMEIG